MVGTCVARVTGQRAWVLRIAIDSGQPRGEGIGSALLQALEERLLRMGVARIAALLPEGGVGHEAFLRQGYALTPGVEYFDKREPLRPADLEALGAMGGRLIDAHGVGGARRDGRHQGADRAPGRAAAGRARARRAPRRRPAQGGGAVRAARHRQDDLRQGGGRAPRVALRRALPQPPRRRGRARARRGAARLLRVGLRDRAPRPVHRRGRRDRRPAGVSGPTPRASPTSC